MYDHAKRKRERKKMRNNEKIKKSFKMCHGSISMVMLFNELHRTVTALVRVNDIESLEESESMIPRSLILI